MTGISSTVGTRPGERSRVVTLLEPTLCSRVGALRAACQALLWQVVIERKTLDIVGSFGCPGHAGGCMTTPHSIDTDAKGNIYIGETWEGKRVQRFLYKGMQTVTKGEDQGTVWPRSTATR